MKYIDAYEGSHVSFWEKFPVFTETQPFKKLYKEDRSKDKNKSSKTMWYLVLAYDLDSEFYNIEESEKDEVIFDVIDLDIKKYLNEDKLSELVDSFIDFIDTPLSSDVRNLERKMLERSKFIRDTPYTLDRMHTPTKIITTEDGSEVEVQAGKPYLIKGTAPQLDKMVTDTKKLHEEVRMLREALREEVSEEGKGGREDSFLEG